jgi:hypothetical protein
MKQSTICGPVRARGSVQSAGLACISCLLFLMTMVFMAHTSLSVYPISCREEKLEVADGVPSAPLLHRWKDCSKGIYLDVGTNVAVQIRKLYEPAKFPGAKVLPVFEEYFGRPEHRSMVCAVGFEPNSVHTAYLQTFNAHFEYKSLPAYVFTDVAVSSQRGNATFYTDPNSAKGKHEWGASLSRIQQSSIIPSNRTITVQLVDLHNFILDMSLCRSLGQSSKRRENSHQS